MQDSHTNIGMRGFSQISSWVHFSWHMVEATSPFGCGGFEQYYYFLGLVDCLKLHLVVVCTPFCLGRDNRMWSKRLVLWKGLSRALCFSMFSYGRLLCLCRCLLFPLMISGSQVSNAQSTTHFFLSFLCKICVIEFSYLHKQLIKIESFKVKYTLLFRPQKTNQGL